MTTTGTEALEFDLLQEEDESYDFELPKRSATLVGMPKYDFHTVPADEVATPRKSNPPAPPRRRRSSSITMPAVRVPEQEPDAYKDVDVEPLSRARRRITSPTMAAITGMPSDHEFKAACHSLDQAREFDRMRDTLLAFPDWIPVSQPMMAIMQEAKRFRQIAAQLLHCDPIDLED